ncbi:uncharacterized protein [Panulirus ornatus]|uniref:uncharacterized protein n=1 Tax=Panulirus ornatus TaxID=150431 RepID=UPI003A842495
MPVNGCRLWMMTRISVLCQFIFLSSLAAASVGSYSFQEDEFLDGQLTLVVEDALDGGPNPIFSPRSTIHVRSVKSGNALVTHTRQWTSELENKLRTLAVNDDLYRIRVYQKGLEDKGYVSTYTKAVSIKKCLQFYCECHEVLMG